MVLLSFLGAVEEGDEVVDFFFVEDDSDEELVFFVLGLLELLLGLLPLEPVLLIAICLKSPSRHSIKKRIAEGSPDLGAKKLKFS